MFDVENEKPLITNIEGASLIEPVVAYGVKLLSIGFFQSHQMLLFGGGRWLVKL